MELSENVAVGGSGTVASKQRDPEWSIRYECVSHGGCIVRRNLSVQQRSKFDTSTTVRTFECAGRGFGSIGIDGGAIDLPLIILQVAKRVGEIASVATFVDRVTIDDLLFTQISCTLQLHSELKLEQSDEGESVTGSTGALIFDGLDL